MTLLNASMEPIYQAVAYLVFVQGAAPKTGRQAQERTGAHFRSLLSVIPPGMHYTSVAGGWGGMSAHPGVELAFTDRAGVHWLRSAEGTLTEIDESPVEYYGVEAPRAWRIPDTAGPS